MPIDSCFNILRKFHLLFVFLFFVLLVSLSSPIQSQADCVVYQSYSPMGGCQANGLGCYGHGSICNSFVGRPNMYSKWEVSSTRPNNACSADRPTIYNLTQYCCSVDSAPNGCALGGSSPARTQVWVRVLSRDGPVGKPIAWKGSQGNDGVWTYWYNGLEPSWSNGTGTFNGTEFTNYKGTERGSVKSWDTARNKVDSAMNFSVTENEVVEPVEFQTDRREYWSNHFCIQGFALKYDSSNPQRIASEQFHGKDSYCSLERRSSGGNTSYVCRYDDTDGCWNPINPNSGDASVYDIYGSNLKRLMDKAINSPVRGDTSWMDLRFDEYWSLNFTTWADRPTQFVLTPPTGYKCKDVRWFKNNNSSTDEETPGTSSSNEFQIENLSNGNCRVHGFSPSDDGNMFIFEVERASIPVGGRVVDSRTGTGISGVTVNVDKYTSSNVYVSTQSTTTDANGYYTVNNFISSSDKYSVYTWGAAGYTDGSYTVNYQQAWGSQIKKGYEVIGWTWNTLAGRDTRVGDGTYMYQTEATGCARANPSQGNTTNRCWFAFDQTVSIGGKVVNGGTGTGLSSIAVDVSRLDVNGNVISTQRANTNSFGDYVVNNFVRFGDKYKVSVASTAPVGFQGAAFAVKYNYAWPNNNSAVVGGQDIPYSWNHTRNPNIGSTTPWANTMSGDVAYDSQKPGGADCSGVNNLGVNNRCWFAFNVQPPPPTVYLTGNVKVLYATPNFNYEKVRYDEFNNTYNVQFLKGGNSVGTGGVWQSAAWNIKPVSGTYDCSANFPNGSSTPNCEDYFYSPASYLQYEYFSARIRLPNNKYSCFWQILGSNGPRLIGSGSVSSSGGSTYCTVQTPSNGSYRVEDMALPTSTELEGPVHINFILVYESNRVMGKMFNSTGTALSSATENLQLKRIFSNGVSSSYFSPYSENTSPNGVHFAWPAGPDTTGVSFNDNYFADYFRQNEKIAFSIPNPTNSYKCGWILETQSGSTAMKTSLSQFGSGFNPSDINTYPAETVSLKRGISSTCTEESGAIAPLTGYVSPIYQNHLYIFKVEKKVRFSAKINKNYPYVDGNAVNTLKNVSYSELNNNIIMETATYNPSTGVYGAWATANFRGTSADCSAYYPNNTTGRSAPFGLPADCSDYYVSSVAYTQGSPLQAVARIKYIPGKYTCSWSINGGANQAAINYTQTGAFGVLFEYCQTSPFTVPADETGAYNVNTEWPTKVGFNIDFKEQSIVNTVFDKATVSTSYSPVGCDSSNCQSGIPVTLAGNRRFYLMPYDNSRGWVSGTSVFMRLNSVPANKVCYYMSQYTNPPYPTGDISSVAAANDWNLIAPGFNPAKSSLTTFSPSCTGMPITIQSGAFSPAYHNQFYTFVAPKLQIGPSTVSVVDSSTQCGQAGTIVSNSINVTVTGDPINTSASFPNGNFSFSDTLYYNPGVYSVGVTVDGLDLNDYGVCPTANNPSGSNPLQINLSTLLPNYPNITDSEALINASIQFYKKDYNKWWQVYNGGIYTGSSSLMLNITSTGEGMPRDAVLVGNANSTIYAQPNEYWDNAGYVGALVSPDTINPNTFTNEGLPGKDWGISDHNEKMSRLDLEKVYDAALQSISEGTEWLSTGSISSAINNDDVNPILVTADTATISSLIDYQKVKNKIILISNASGNSTLNINANVTSPDNDIGIAIVLVRGNVVIDPAVLNLRMVIYATGTISIPARPTPDTDDVLVIRGALYSDTNVSMDRDLPDTLQYEKHPSVRVIYTPEIFNAMDDIGSEGFPSILTESKAYWVIQE